jgi:alpha-1,3-mannosyltransferase
VLFTSNLIGVLFARSLHYQFYTWYAQQIPFLAWRTRYPVFVKCAPLPIDTPKFKLKGEYRLSILLAIEYAWNIFPATCISSGILFVANSSLLIGIWLGHAEGKSRQSFSEAPALALVESLK